MKITFFGTTTLLFDDSTDQILFDAHFTRPSLAKYITGAMSETSTAMCDELMRLHHIGRFKAIFVSHSHHDHVMDAPYIANKCDAMIYGSSSARNVALGGGIPEDRIVVFEDGGEYSVGSYKIRILKSLHSKPTILNNDLGVPIEKPLQQPVSLREYKEGGSYDFYIEHGDKKILIRPSFNYIENQLNGIQADILFLGVAGLAKADEEAEKAFFRETVEKVQPRLVIPVHWDNFFSSLEIPVKGMPRLIEKTDVVFFKLARYCEEHDVNFLIQYPRTSIEI